MSSEDRRRRTRRLLAFAGVLVLVLGAGIAIGAAIAPASPATAATAVVNRATAAVTKAGTYHYIEQSAILGAPDNIEGDAAPNGGRQIIRQQCRPVSSATTARTSVFDLRLVDGVVYFRGNLVAVVDELGVPAARAPTVAGKWVKVVHGEAPYTTFADGITTSSNISQLRGAIVPLSSKAVPGSSPASTEVLGALRRTTKHNRTEGTAVLVVRTASGLPRTLRGSEVAQSRQLFKLTWVFSRYGEKVDVVAPPHVLPYASLHARKPPKTTCA
jgi:hypothetical protein